MEKPLIHRVGLGLLTAAALTASVCAAERVTREVPEGCVRLSVFRSGDQALVGDVVVCPGASAQLPVPGCGPIAFALAEEAD